jgi:hypothetical protein
LQLKENERIFFNFIFLQAFSTTMSAQRRAV